jgi:hypothetical protein
VVRQDPRRRRVPFSKSTPLRSSDTNDKTSLVIFVNVLGAWRTPDLGGGAAPTIGWRRWARGMPLLEFHTKGHMKPRSPNIRSRDPQPTSPCAGDAVLAETELQFALGQGVSK